jgi:hypothetical protein
MIDNDTTALVTRESEDARDTLAIVRDLPCETPEDQALLNDVLVQVRDRTKALDRKQDEILDPLKASIKAVKALFAPPLDAFAALEKAIRDKVSARALALKAENEKARALAIQAAQAGDQAATQAALATVRHAATDLGNLAVTYGWEGAIEDFDQIPREWLTLDVSRVKIYCRDHAKSEAIPPVPGLKFTRTASTRAKA